LWADKRWYEKQPNFDKYWKSRWYSARGGTSDQSDAVPSLGPAASDHPPGLAAPPDPARHASGKQEPAGNRYHQARDCAADTCLRNLKLLYTRLTTKAPFRPGRPTDTLLQRIPKLAARIEDVLANLADADMSKATEAKGKLSSILASVGDAVDVASKFGIAGEQVAAAPPTAATELLEPSTDEHSSGIDGPAAATIASATATSSETKTRTRTTTRTTTTTTTTNTTETTSKVEKPAPHKARIAASEGQCTFQRTTRRGYENSNSACAGAASSSDTLHSIEERPLSKRQREEQGVKEDKEQQPPRQRCRCVAHDTDGATTSFPGEPASNPTTELVCQIVRISGAKEDLATHLLEAANNDVNMALDILYDQFGQHSAPETIDLSHD
jgi:ElaB/YqjD/DUF883 family membrane-anchored ribosome-binding protein